MYDVYDEELRLGRDGLGGGHKSQRKGDFGHSNATRSYELRVSLKALMWKSEGQQ